MEGTKEGEKEGERDERARCDCAESGEERGQNMG
jgi:hypothetical protein